MSQILSHVVLFISAVAMIVISVISPQYISDSNKFLENFVNHELLNILGVILAITLASVANIHLAFNRIEERYGAPNALHRSRSNLRKAAYWLIGLFVSGAIIVVVKPVACSGPVSSALFNTAALVVLIWHILILMSLTELVFRIEPEFPNSVKKRDDGEESDY